MNDISREEFRQWKQSRVGEWFFDELRKRRAEELSEVEDGRLRGDRDSGVSTEFKAGEISGTLGVLAWILRGRIDEDLSTEEVNKR